MTNTSRTAASSILLIFSLYVLQGVNLGLTASMPLFLIARGATWKDRGTFNFAYYPFSFKLLWAPLIDTLYSERFGRRKSWLIPIQLSIGAILTLLSFYIESLIHVNSVGWLTAIFFGIVFLTATQDICVDGLAITLFAATNPQWASTSQSVGQTLGRFTGFSFLLTFESANFTNRFIRKPLSLDPTTSGLFSIERFVLFIALAFLAVTMCLTLILREKKERFDQDGEETNRFTLKQTYLSMVELCKKKCIQQLSLVSFLAPFGMVPTNYMTSLSLISQGVPKENLALVNVPVTLIAIIAPLLIRHTKLPLIWFAGSYLFYLISAIPIAAFVYFTPQILLSSFYYPLLIFLLALNEFIMILRFAAQVGFFASISDPRIGGTYMTFLVTIHNLGFALNSSLVLYVAEWLPKKYAYVLAVGLCISVGTIWFSFSYRILQRLQRLPTQQWYLASRRVTSNPGSSEQDSRNDYQMSLIANKEEDDMTKR